MNWQRGFFWLWLFLAALWWVPFAWMYRPNYARVSAKLYGNSFADLIPDNTPAWNEVASVIVAPFILLAAGAFLGWALSGLKK